MVNRMPAAEYRSVRVHAPEELYRGVDRLVNGAVGVIARRPRVLQDLLREAADVAARSEGLQDLGERVLRDRLLEMRDRFRRHPDSEAERVREALALLREAAARSTGLRPYPVQIAGALALHQGALAEMATGEGKTLTSALAAVLAGWTRRPCHVITVNDYLARRDAREFQDFYRMCGLRCGFVLGEQEPEARREAYDADVTYTTSKEITADFLRDRLRLGPVDDPLRREVRRLVHPRFGATAELVQRGLHTAIVDEADSVLIDEAVTPVLISRPYAHEGLVAACRTARKLVAGLEPGRDYVLDPRYREARLRPEALGQLEDRCAGLDGLWRSGSRRRELLEQALVAEAFFQRGTQYVVEEGKVVIVDESTGRKMPMRTWREGLHQAIECKENLEPSDPSETLARISFQRFFRQYRQLSGMTGTAREAAGEFWQIYALPVVTIPTHRPCVRVDAPDRVSRTAQEKWDAVVAEIQSLHATGRPVLVGTRDITASETVAERLDGLGIPYHLLNAVHHAEEARIVAEAGERGRVTLATNMAGRGTDIRLGEGVRELGGLHVLITERHLSRRIDRQLAGRAARQGDPGRSSTFVSLEDDLLRRFAFAPALRMVARHTRPDADGSWPAASRLVDATQRRAQRQAFRQRVSVLRTDTWIDRSLAFARGS